MKIVETEMNQEIFERIKLETEEQRASFNVNEYSFLSDRGFYIDALDIKYYGYPKLYVEAESKNYIFKIPNFELNPNDTFFRSFVFYKNELYVFIISQSNESFDVYSSPNSIILSYQKEIPLDIQEELLALLKSYFRIVGRNGRGWGKDDDRYSNFIPVEIKITNDWFGREWT